MKKLFALMLVLCVWLPFCAFKDVVGGAVINSTGKVNEVVTIQYSTEDAQKLNLTFNELHSAVTQLAPSIQTILQTKYQLKIDFDSSLTFEEKNALKQQVKIVATQQMLEDDGQFVVNITYETKAAWNWFCSEVTEQAIETTEKNLFIKNYVTKMPIKLSTITDNLQEVSLLNFTYEKFIIKLSQQLGKNISAVLSTSYSYVYATNVARLHSDAKQVEYNSSTGLTYYLWEFAFDENNPQITLWQTRANVVTWYCLALGLTAIFGIVLFVVAKNKKQKTFDED